MWPRVHCLNAPLIEHTDDALTVASLLRLKHAFIMHVVLFDINQQRAANELALLDDERTLLFELRMTTMSQSTHAVPQKQRNIE